jgi:hypothetical protein
LRGLAEVVKELRKLERICHLRGGDLSLQGFHSIIAHVVSDIPSESYRGYEDRNDDDQRMVP